MGRKVWDVKHITNDMLCFAHHMTWLATDKTGQENSRDFQEFQENFSQISLPHYIHVTSKGNKFKKKKKRGM